MRDADEAAVLPGFGDRPGERSNGLSNAANPAAPAERIQIIDSLRGLALFGVLVMNLETEFRVSIFEDFLPSLSVAGVDRAVETALRIFVDLKAFAIFSLLFGTGLAIQHERLQRHPARLTLLFRRLLALLVFGLIHLYLIWNGDILAEYALAGLLVLPFLYAPTRVIAALSAALLLFYILMPVLRLPVSLPDTAWMERQVAAANEIYSSGGFVDILRFRIQEVPALLPLHIMILPRTVGLFLLGIVAWRSQILRNAEHRSAGLAALAAIGITGGFVLTLGARNPAALSALPLGRLTPFMAPSATIAFAVGYSCLVLVLGNVSRLRGFFAYVAPMGRMAFTNYICQSIILGLVFYGYGLGLFGKIGMATGLALALLIYVLQAFASRWWLQRYRFGPLEWLWRTVMYGRYADLRR